MAEALADVYVRLEGFTGECTDDQHSGEDGWIQIKSFNFGFGMKEGSWDNPDSTAASSNRGSSSSTGGARSGSSSGSRRSRPGSGRGGPALAIPEATKPQNPD